MFGILYIHKEYEVITINISEEFSNSFYLVGNSPQQPRTFMASILQTGLEKMPQLKELFSYINSVHLYSVQPIINFII